MTPRRTRVTATMRGMVLPARLLLALKAALTATAAWLIGRLMPGDIGQYVYYAPLGALIAMTPTIASSVGGSIRTVTGLLLGVGTAWALILLGMSGPLALFLAVGVGTVLAGLAILGPGRDYIPIAAAFVFLIGGANADEFSIGYVVQFGLGACLGVLVNLVIPPPLETRAARESVARLRDEIADCVELLADSVDDFPDDGSAPWSDPLDDIALRVDEAHESLHRAWESRRGNVRARNPRTRVEDVSAALPHLQRIVRQLHEVSESLLEAEDEQPGLPADVAHTVTVRVPREIRAAISQAGHDTATLVRSAGADGADRDTTASEALRTLAEANRRAADWTPPTVRDRERVYVVIFALRRIIAEVR